MAIQREKVVWNVVNPDSKVLSFRTARKARRVAAERGDGHMLVRVATRKIKPKKPGDPWTEGIFVTAGWTVRDRQLVKQEIVAVHDMLL